MFQATAYRSPARCSRPVSSPAPSWTAPVSSTGLTPARPGWAGAAPRPGIDRDVAEPVGVGEQGGREEQAPAAGREVAVRDGARVDLLPGGARVEGNAVYEPQSGGSLLPQVQDVVAHGVDVDDRHPAVVPAEARHLAAVAARAERLEGAVVEPPPVGGEELLGARLRVQVDDPPLLVHLHAVAPVLRERRAERGLGEAAADRDDHRLVVLVPVPVDHHEDLPLLREDPVREPPDQLGVLQGKVRGQERLGDAPSLVHRVQAQAAGQVGDEVDPVAHPLGREEEAGREERVDADRAGRCHGRLRDDRKGRRS